MLDITEPDGPPIRSVKRRYRTDDVLNKIRKKELKMMVDGFHPGWPERTDLARVRLLELQVQEHDDWVALNSATTASVVDTAAPTSHASSSSQSPRPPVASAELPSHLTAQHALDHRDGITWCGICGRLSQGRKLQHLRDKCPGTTSSGYGRQRLSRLERGVHPYTSHPLGGSTRRLCMADIAQGSSINERTGVSDHG